MRQRAEPAALPVEHFYLADTSIRIRIKLDLGLTRARCGIVGHVDDPGCAPDAKSRTRRRNLHIAGLGNQAGLSTVSNYALMVDNDGDGDFKTGTLTFFNATSASGKKIIFSNVTLNDNVVFTVITLKSSLLPAIWLGFTAQGVDGNALLNWKTSDEMNVDRYVVEHSFNGVSFATVGSVAANNSTGVNQYSFTHAGLAPGLHYYRIRRIDKDGKSDYTDTKTVKISTTGANVQVRPNPVVGSTLVLAVTVQQSSKTFVQVLSVDGKVMLQQSINLTAGNNLVNLNVSNVPTGIYLVQVQLADEVATKKFIRQR